ncbi:lac repressor [Raoultella terrigena]|uniref:Lac repressor n=1 Tax=Raoultella terrigena TaxID=577 RepID=A0A485BML3_RAOTE|nr:lac repressor [Raoultella terrigena]
MKRKNKVTMNDIARTAGVSQATVSLVLNQSRNIKLSEETRQRVIAVATELGYDRLPAIHAPRNQEEVALLVSTPAKLRSLYRCHQPGAGSGLAQ